MNNDNLKISSDLYKLDESELGDNLYYYTYKVNHLKKLLNSNIDKDDPSFISTYSSFKGEVYENVVYELLLRYAKENKNITKFILKGPHQSLKENIKNGFGIDIKEQIVYKSGYKDISEFDGLFFTKGSIYFVESTMTKATMSLRKRLRKKKALLDLLFPNIKIKALIILTDEATGVGAFPDYCTVWQTQPINVDTILDNLINNPKRELTPLNVITDEKFSHANSLRYFRFKYFDTMLYVLNKTRSNPKISIDIMFLQTSKVDQYFDIFTKLYIGYLMLNDFKSIAPSFDLNIEENIVWVSIEKLNIGKYLIVYFAKQINGKLKRVEIHDDKITIADKETKGFSTSEYKYLKHILKPHHRLKLKDINIVQKKFINKSNLPPKQQ